MLLLNVNANREPESDRRKRPYIPDMAERRKKSSMLALGFAARLKKLREARGLTQKDLASRVDIEVVQISRYERGQYLPNAETLVALARVLQVDLNLLLLGDPAAAPQAM